MIDVNSIEMSKNGIYGKVHGEYFSLFDFTQKKLMERISMPSLITYFKNEKQFIRTDFENYYMIKPKIFLIYFKNNFYVKYFVFNQFIYLYNYFKTIIKKQYKTTKKNKKQFFYHQMCFLDLLF